MNPSDGRKLALLETTLLRTAEAIGDLPHPVIQEFYRRHPEARNAFEFHGASMRERLEAEMIDKALYSIMTWFERPDEIVNLFQGSVPHHRFMLHVHADWYAGLLGSVIDQIARNIPLEAADELSVIEELRHGLLGAVQAALAFDQPDETAP